MCRGADLLCVYLGGMSRVGQPLPASALPISGTLNDSIAPIAAGITGITNVLLNALDIGKVGHQETSFNDKALLVLGTLLHLRRAGHATSRTPLRNSHCRSR